MTSCWEYDCRHSFPFDVLISHWHRECKYVDKMPLSSAEAVFFIIGQQARMTMCDFANRNHMGYKCTQRLFPKPKQNQLFQLRWCETQSHWGLDGASGRTAHTLNHLKFCNVFACAKERLVHIKAAMKLYTSTRDDITDMWTNEDVLLMLTFWKCHLRFCYLSDCASHSFDSIITDEAFKPLISFTSSPITSTRHHNISQDTKPCNITNHFRDCMGEILIKH